MVSNIKASEITKQLKASSEELLERLDELSKGIDGLEEGNTKIHTLLEEIIED